MRLPSKILFTAALLLFVGPAARAQARAEELPKGTVIAKVVAAADSSQSYALYLPSSYTPSKKWPILYCFDPAARGAFPVERYKAAAERYGWIVVGSHNSQNGPWQPSIDAAKVLWDDTHARFSIDERRRYATGFSGGARVATSLGLICDGCMAGVIAHGAGFNPRADLSKAPPFAFFGAIGTNDYNFPELVALGETLGRLGVARRVVTFEGGHQWATSEVCEEAVAWMELRAMKSGARPKDTALLEELWAKESARARAAEESQDFYAAFKTYRALAESFAGLRDAAGAESKAARLEETKEVKRARGEEHDEIKKQQQLVVRLLTLAQASRTGSGTGDDEGGGLVAASSFRGLASELRAQARAERDTSARRVARRVLGAAFAQFYEGAEALRRGGKDADETAFQMQMASELSPDNPHVLFELAAAQAANRQKKKALETLRRAVEKGFADPTRMANEKALDPLRGEEEFKRITSRMSDKP